MSEEKPDKPMYNPWLIASKPKPYLSRKIGGGQNESESKLLPANRRTWFDIINKTEKQEKYEDRVAQNGNENDTVTPIEQETLMHMEAKVTNRNDNHMKGTASRNEVPNQRQEGTRLPNNPNEELSRDHNNPLDDTIMITHPVHHNRTS